MSALAKAKFNMIEQQIRPWEVLDNRVLSTFDHLNRDEFVPSQYRDLAYADCQIPLATGRSMLPPTVEGRMLQALNLSKSDSVLEVGTGCGYITACLAHLANSVDSVDFDSTLTETVQQQFDNLKLRNIRLSIEATVNDISNQPRYDAIAVCAGSLEEIPQNLKQALVIGGRIFAVCGHSPVKQATLLTRTADQHWESLCLFETDIPAIN